ncbi:hypothetical protein BJP40_20850 [Streptomyces sp. CC53]|uniref:ATP-binding cassette domain-containing protein n=1 Tax=unclassified Streptomyces TaxID=2593676 RepID=UPI0008DC82AE|nr:hypothetical protein BJP40_20850 [Streptomyces sp. CC53]OII67953.1 hypothetical protein BJP39_23085 [Streptomyces sp. CC77]
MSGVRRVGASVAHGGTPVPGSFALTVEPGEVTALPGPSGSGGTTAPRAVAGSAGPAAGRVRLGGCDVTGLPPDRGGLGMAVRPGPNVRCRARRGDRPTALALPHAAGPAKGAPHAGTRRKRPDLPPSRQTRRRAGEARGGSPARTGIRPADALARPGDGVEVFAPGRRDADENPPAYAGARKKATGW